MYVDHFLYLFIFSLMSVLVTLFWLCGNFYDKPGCICISERGQQGFLRLCIQNCYSLGHIASSSFTSSLWKSTPVVIETTYSLYSPQPWHHFSMIASQTSMRYSYQLSFDLHFPKAQFVKYFQYFLVIFTSPSYFLLWHSKQVMIHQNRSDY